MAKIARSLSRRGWFASLAGLIFPTAQSPDSGVLRADDGDLAGAVETEGANRSARPTSFEAVEDGVTPVDQFFSRSHHQELSLRMTEWGLRVEGTVRAALEIDFADLLECPRQKLEAVLECAGNRGYLVSNGIWEGVPLSYLLEEAGLKPDTEQILFEGVDIGSLIEGRPAYPFARVVPVAQCLNPKALVAFKLNGQFLPPRNGFPARLLFPGTYAMDAVKWLRRIVGLRAGEKPESFYASGMNLLYRRWVRESGEQRIGSPVSTILVRSAVAFPSNGARLATGPYTVWGFAWSGAGAIRAVEVSTDGGSSWSTAKLEPQDAPFGWTRWSIEWTAKEGDHELLARARDDSGHIQPRFRDTDRIDGYECNWSEAVKCSVR